MFLLVSVSISTNRSENALTAPQVEATDRQQNYKIALYFVKYLTPNSSLFYLNSLFRHDNSSHITPQRGHSISQELPVTRQALSFTQTGALPAVKHIPVNPNYIPKSFSNKISGTGGETWLILLLPKKRLEFLLQYYPKRTKKKLRNVVPFL